MGFALVNQCSPMEKGPARRVWGRLKGERSRGPNFTPIAPQKGSHIPYRQNIRGKRAPGFGQAPHFPYRPPRHGCIEFSQRGFGRMTAKAEIPPAKGNEMKVFGRTPKSTA